MIWLAVIGIPVTVVIAIVTGEPAWLISTIFAIIGTWLELKKREADGESKKT